VLQSLFFIQDFLELELTERSTYSTCQDYVGEVHLAVLLVEKVVGVLAEAGLGG